MGTEHHAIANFRVTVAGFLTGTAKGHAMQEAHVIADYGGFANHDIGGVVNQETMSDFGGRMKVHSELAADNALDHLGREGTPLKPQGMSGTVGLQSLESLEEQERLQIAGAGGVAHNGRMQVLACAIQKLRILQVKKVEHLFELGAIHHFASELTRERYRKHRGKVLAVQDLLGEHQHRKRFVVDQLFGFAANFLFNLFDGHFLSLSSSSSSRVGITLFSLQRFSSRILKVKSTRLFSNIFW